MTQYIQASAGILLAVILGLALGKNGKEAAILISILVCCMVASIAVGYLEPVVEYMKRLQQDAQMDSTVLTVLLKVVGIGMISEIVALICSDVGNSAMGKAMQILASAVVLWLSIPVLESLLELVSSILGEI